MIENNNILIASPVYSQSHSSHSGLCTLASSWLQQLLSTSVEKKRFFLMENVRALLMP